MQNDPQPTNLSRRRLAKGGMAAPVVLASIASKNAFATAPYLCTISGKMSNNMSPHGPAGSTTQPNCKIGGSKTAVQRKLTGDNTTFQSIFSSPTPLYFTNGNNQSATLLAGQQRNGAQDWQSATAYSILKLTDSDVDPSAPPKELLLARQAIVLRANAIANPGDRYPVQASVV
ncbi:MAG: hypothetical protein ABI589_10850, partial [Burkholderiales bacterium]